MGLRCGIVGLPNVGKSTLFNAISESSKAQAANYPFCTIEPNKATIRVEDERLGMLAEISRSKKVIPATVELVDIAGLVEGASSGAGLGNKFLSHIREVDAILHVVRCFKDESVDHVCGGMDPLRDIAIIENELILADLAVLEKHLLRLEKKNRLLDTEPLLLETVKDLTELLNGARPASSYPLMQERHKEVMGLQLITSKPLIYICNLDESSISSGNEQSNLVSSLASSRKCFSVSVSAKIESEIALIDAAEDKGAFLNSLGLKRSGASAIVRCAYEVLGLMSYFTTGPEETRMWTIRAGTKAPQAAGVIHSDFEEGFIKAEVLSWEEYLKLGKWMKFRTEGKDYLVRDGDVMNFKFAKVK